MSHALVPGTAVPQVLFDSHRFDLIRIDPDSAMPKVCRLRFGWERVAISRDGGRGVDMGTGQAGFGLPPIRKVGLKV
jgi:hypothetical protein